MQRFFSCVAFILCLFVSAGAMASDACYDEVQLHAEQLLRLHSELMVITVTCRESSSGQSLASAYGDFTKKNIHVLHDAEQTLTDYYRQHAKGNPTDHLDRLRTILANEFGQKSANMGSSQFCESFSDRVIKYDAASPSDVENEAKRMSISERSYVAPCGAGKTRVAKGN